MRVVVTGSNGLLGKAISQIYSSQDSDEHELLFFNRKTVDLQDRRQLVDKFQNAKPDLIIHLASRIAGSHSQDRESLDVYSGNLQIFQNVVHAAKLAGTKRILFASSYHALSLNNATPFVQSNFEPTHITDFNFSHPYSAAKATEILFSISENAINSKQSNLTLTPLVMPNLFGPNDKFNSSASHFIPAAIVKLLTAKEARDPVFQASGNPDEVREYVYSLDAARLICDQISSVASNNVQIISSGQIFTTRYCWETIRDVVGFRGRMEYSDSTNSPRRDMFFSNSTINPTEFQNSIQETVDWYIRNRASSR